MKYEHLGYSLAVGILAFGFFFSFLQASSLPDVHISYSTKECITVINYNDTEYTCDNYPKKYNHIWVE